MIAWIAVLVPTFSLATILGLILRTSMRPLDETDERCSDMDEALDAQYGGWRN
jgi:hypothetical protein